MTAPLCNDHLDSFIVSSRPPPTPLATSQEIRDRASAFIAYIYAAATESQANSCVNHTKRVLHSEKPASHVMFAWRCMLVKAGCTGLGGEDEFEVKEGSEDDGEKYGGQKILTAMRKQGTLDAVVVVCRWYGGTMLGPVRFTHIETSTLEVCREFKRQEDIKAALATLRTLDDLLAQLREQLGSSSKAKTPDYTGWIDWDLERAHRLVRARESAISNTKKLIAKHQQKPT
ncbi:UPF0029 domain-containing protein [Mycena indigotica]|uniref:UPF0029 domain-containing protein n=1 Tax=Mycena indigotica TaxID=2126181 RepID=A0A8H6WDZ3_9AGAR|nr:UPF0029 domain-containing protein [Mycena indigotica]KAF7315164.1 UPF0029 domain-containing protein [Mycena indigotica]